MNEITVDAPTNSFPIGIVVSRFNQPITEALLEGAVDELRALHISENDITVLRVPGAVEIPLAAQWLANTKKYQAIITLGAVIYGETRHFDYVCNQVSEGCQRVMLDHHIPVSFGVLTTLTLEQAHDRIGGRKGHMGREAARAAVEMAAIMKKILPF